MRKRVLVAGLCHESHTFLDGRTAPEDFRSLQGDALLAACGDGSPLGGALEQSKAFDWEVLPVVDMRATPGATVEDRVVDTFWHALKDTVKRQTQAAIDGVFLVLHGAMVSEALADVEGEILTRLRSLSELRDVPVCGTLDLHGNISPRIESSGEAFVAYRENPHTDGEATGKRAARILDQLMQSGERPVTVWDQPPVVWPPCATSTAEDPMRTLQRMARDYESSGNQILAVNVFGGFAYADTLHTGVSFTAVTLGDPLAARREIGRLSEWARSHCSEGIVIEPEINDVMADVLAHAQGPVLLVEPADNIGGGAPGDATGVLRALLKYDTQNAVVVINDPESVVGCHGAAPGERMTLLVGGKANALSGDSVKLQVELVSTSDGVFEIEDHKSHLASMYGTRIEMGPCAVVKHGGIHVLLTSRRTPPFDLAQLRSQGIEPERARIIGVKAAVAHRRAYDPIAVASYTVATPGVCSSDLRCFPFKRIRRPVYPLDEI